MKTCRDLKLNEAITKIAAACTGKLKRDILAGKVAIPAKEAMTISRMAPPMRAAQARSYAETGKALKLPLYRDVVDAALEMIQAQGVAVLKGDDGLAALAQALNVAVIPGPAGGVVDVPPLDTEKVSELGNRLDRALGLVAKVVVDLARLHAVRPTRQEEATLQERLDKLAAFAGLVGDLLRQPAARFSASLKPYPGTYIVLLHLNRVTRFPRVGPFGPVQLPKGWFTYTGSAFGSGGVRARVGHHATVEKANLVWHLDYVRPAMTIEEVWTTYDHLKHECAWAKLIYEHLGGTVVVPGFGSADCKKLRAPQRCQAHFCHFRQRPSWDTFSQAVQQAIPEHAHIEVVDGEAVMQHNRLT